MSGTPPDLAPHIAPSVVNRLRPPSVWGKEWKGDDERAPGQMPGPPAYPMKQWGAHRVLLQGFNWESCKHAEKSKDGKTWYKVMEMCAGTMSRVGVTDVWFPPSSQSVAPQGYLPGMLYDLKTPYGNEDELKSTIDTLHKHGIACIADIVINHRCASFQDENGIWNQFEGGTPDEKLDWGSWAIVKGDAKFAGSALRSDTGEDYDAAPDIDHRNETVQKDLSEWMRWLRDEVGFDGWRWDYAKGFAPWVIGALNAQTNPVFSVIEYWSAMGYGDGGLNADQDHHRQELCNYVDASVYTATEHLQYDGDNTVQSTGAFDFTTKGILQDAVGKDEFWRLKDKDGNPPGLLGWWPESAITFLDNHDTGSTQGHWPFPGEFAGAGYAYILTHPGYPCLFWDHVFDWGEELKTSIELMVRARIRNRVGGRCEEVVIHRADHECYLATIKGRAESDAGDARLAEEQEIRQNPASEVTPWLGGEVVERRHGELAVRIGHGDAGPPGDGWDLVCEGPKFCVWERRAAE